jgi:hypothetical protein
MSAVTVSEVATVLTRVKFDRRRLNQELDALSAIDYEALEKRFIIDLVDYRKLIETVLDGWVQKPGFQATLGVLCRALECNEDRLASGKSTNNKSNSYYSRKFNSDFS